MSALFLALVVVAMADDAGAQVQVDAIEARATRIRQVIDGTLDPALDPQSFFDVSLHDEPAIEIEVARLRAMLAAIDAGSDARSLWASRLDLDRARLSFLSLERDEREALLQAAEARRHPPTDLDEAARKQVLEAATAARSEAQRALGEQIAALLELQAQIKAVRTRFQDDRAALSSRRDERLGWEKRLRDAESSTAEEVDALYDSLRAALRKARDELSSSLDDSASSTSEVPKFELAPIDAPADLSLDRWIELRAEVQHSISEARDEEHALRTDRSSMLVETIDHLNRARLALLPMLSDQKRAQITGLTPAGFDQAHSEARHLILILRHQQRAAVDWFNEVRAGRVSPLAGLTGAASGATWVIVLLAFVWLRSRTPKWLAAAEHRAAEDDRLERRTEPSAGRRWLAFAQRVQRPVEWSLFLGVTVWLLPASTRAVLEVQLLLTVAMWLLGGSLGVRVVDALASELRHSHGETPTDTLRLRSLRLVGGTVVVFGVVLTVSSRLVGRGTIFAWVFFASWLAGVPIVLVLVRWWKVTVFERIERQRKKNGLERWVLAHRDGWSSFIAAMLGGVELLVRGTWKALVSRISRIDLARRAHAWLFRREIDRLESETRGKPALLPLASDRFDALSPNARNVQPLPMPAESLRTTILTRMKEGRGGVIAVVGGRGMGKSTLFEQLALAVPESRLMAPDPTEVEAVLADATAVRLALIDDIQTLIRPLVGGLATFDALLSALRTRGRETLWVMALDSSVWPFLRRARDGRPLFDEVLRLPQWNEDELGQMLRARSLAAGFTPSYGDLLDPLPAAADEIDRVDALQARGDGYMRMLWDHVSGNPGLALEAWRRSLGEDEEGGVHVRPLQVPEPERLNALPDTTLFVLRATLQLAPASVEDLLLATRLNVETINSTLRFGEAQGYFIAEHGRYHVSWRWLRAVLRILERRHLLVNP